MATNTRGPKSTAAKRTPARAKPAGRQQSAGTTLQRVAETAGGYAGPVVKTVRSRPYTAVAFLAGTAAAAAFLWVKRAVIGEQTAAAREKISDLREQAGEQAGILREEAGEKVKAFRGKLNERFVASGEATEIDVEGEARAHVGEFAPRKSQSEIAAEALSLKQIGETDRSPGEQSKVGAIAY